MWGGSPESTLTVFEQGCILASFHHGSKHHRVFPVVSRGAVLIDKPECRQTLSALSRTGLSLPAECGMHYGQEITNSVIDASSQGLSMPQDLPHRGILRIPMEVDVFRSVDQNVTPREDFRLHLARWSRFWTQSLPDWISVCIGRKRGMHGDTYWFPPGTSMKQKYIRSGSDLRSYLDFCSSTSQQHGEGATPDHVNLLFNWKMKLEIEKRNKPKKRQSKRGNR